MQNRTPAPLVSFRTPHNRSNRRGITLLFVVSMIVLFLLMGATFVIVSSDYLRNARRRGRVDLQRDPGPVLLDRAFYDLLRGPDLSNSTSPLRGHSLLADMYGYGFTAEIATAASDTSGHFITLTLDQASVETLLPQDAAGTTAVEIEGGAGAGNLDINPVPGLFNGQLLSFVSGNANGLTTRIIDHQVTGDANSGFQHTFIVQPAWTDNGVDPDTDILAEDRIVINGRPFSGSGAGYYQPDSDYDQPTLGPSVAGRVPSALQPNQRNRTRQQLLFGGGGYDGYLARQVRLNPNNSSVNTNHSGPAESYDAVDFQNMFLAAIDQNGAVIDAETSFHRPSLIEYLGANSARGDFRAFSFPNNPTGGIVVDNNADGTPDGIWMDIGLPLQTDSSGRNIKPLVSYLVTDMDGKFNVNAHGDLVDIQPDGFISSHASMLGQPNFPGFDPPNRGSGYGPAEVNMQSFFGNATATNLLSGNANYDGRYGADDVPGGAGRDNWSAYKLFGYPNGGFAGNPPGTVGNHFFSPMDIHGRFAFGFPQVFDDKVDNTFPVGMPIADILGSTLTTEVQNSAYEMNFAPSPFTARSTPGIDQPFSPEELERVLRLYDRDANMLPDRLLALGGGVNQWSSPGNRRHSVTTDSWEVPTTFTNLPSQLYEILNSQVTNYPDPPFTSREQYLRYQVLQMLPAEVFAGLPMDVNRPFGDGVDNNANGVIDDAGEVTAERLQHPDGSSYALDLVDDTTNTTNSDALFARAAFARNLYIVTLIATEWVDRNGDGNVNDNDWFDFNNDNQVNADDRIAYRRMVAQWAINVVDFRDPDSIMTPFEVDLNPWDGWNVDGNLATNENVGPPVAAIPFRHVYWGCERPDLLITETFASHDRRTQDTNLERRGNRGRGRGQGARGSTTTDNPPDIHFDSHLVPQASAFFELYNPWVMNRANQIVPAETSDPARTGVNIQKTVPGVANANPVFRLVIADYDPANLDLNDPTKNANGQLPDVHRRIYFTQPHASVDSGPEVYYPEAGIAVGPVRPGRYAVVGSAGVRQVGDRYDTYFGRTTANVLPPNPGIGQPPLDTDELENNTRRISLNPTGNQVEILNWNGAQMATTTRTDVVALPIGVNAINNGIPRSLGISDPLLGYDPAYNPNPQIAQFAEVEAIEDGYKYVRIDNPQLPPNVPVGSNYYFNEPVDSILQSADYQEFLKDDGLTQNQYGTTAFRMVHLQRLANPMLPFNAVTNPYISIDFSGVDLFRFNGIEADPPEDPENEPGVLRFGSTERRTNKRTVQQDQHIARNRYRMLFKSDADGKNPQNDNETPDLAGVDDHIFSRNVLESFGYLNTGYVQAVNPIAIKNPTPFAWLSWNNRPYVSHLELANVPFYSPFWMMSRFDVSDTTRDVYAPPKDDNPGQDITGGEQHSGHFAHLLNFHSDLNPGSSSGTTSDWSPWMFRLMDYVEVPSRFVGTESRTNPGTFTATTPNGLNRSFAPPFDSISNYRYPGKININTVFDNRVWEALMGGDTTSTLPVPSYANSVTYNEWNRSRQGVAADSPTTVPTAYANPYRESDAFNNVPIANMVVPPADTGLFRRENPVTPTALATPLFTYQSTAIYNDTDRNAYFKYGLRQRLGNLVTNRSSVFAIWVTVGFFEVDSTGNPIQGQEVGWETGEVKRHRGFYVVDRSIPVAFEPGKNHNSQRAIRIRSIIE